MVRGGPPGWRADPPPPARPPGRATLRWRVGPSAGEAEDKLSLDALTPDVAERLLDELTSRLVAVERDLVHFPISYYFSAGDPRFSLPVAAPYLPRIARRGMHEAQPTIVRFRARLLMQAIEDLARTTATQFHGSDATTPEELLSGYAQDHLVHER